MSLPAGDKKKSKHMATKVTAQEKRDFEEACERLGTSPSVAMRHFVEAVNYNWLDKTIEEVLREVEGVTIEQPNY